LPGRSEESIHLALLPTASDENHDALLAEWERLYAIRDDVLRALEEARVAKRIGSSLEAKVILNASGGALELLQKHQNDLRYLFIVSQVELGNSDAGARVSITITHADGTKCERCWNYSTRVGESETYPTVCERCVAALHEIEQE
jgi:isoleucyl-tRNA synthetase